MMLFFGKPLEEVDESHINTIIGRASEVKTLEFKRELPGNSDEDKKEFLADVSSFANASGGQIVYGIEESGGVASKISGLTISDLDKTILQLENIVRDGISPRLPIFELHGIKLNSGDFVIIASIPKSWNAPHVVAYKKRWRFYSRNSAGKYPLDVGEVRNAFIASETLSERIRNFRMDRLAKIIAAETPVSLSNTPKIILHSIPLNAFESPYQLPLAQVETNWDIKKLIGSYYRFNFDGYLGYRGDSESGGVEYTQIFRNGILEYVDTRVMYSSPQWDESPPRIIPSTDLEETILEAANNFFKILHILGLEPPILLSLSLTGVLGRHMGVAPHRAMFKNNIAPIDRDNLIVPEILVEDFTQPSHAILRPALDAVWNASSWAGSLNYDEHGNWRQHS